MWNHYSPTLILLLTVKVHFTPFYVLFPYNYHEQSLRCSFDTIHTIILLRQQQSSLLSSEIRWDICSEYYLQSVNAIINASSPFSGGKHQSKKLSVHLSIDWFLSWSWSFATLSIKEFYAATHSRQCYFASKGQISRVWKHNMGLLNLLWRLRSRSMCAARLHCSKKRICRKRVFLSYDEIFYDLRTLVFWQECFQAWFTCYVQWGARWIKKLSSCCDIIQIREINDCKSFSK